MHADENLVPALQFSFICTCHISDCTPCTTRNTIFLYCKTQLKSEKGRPYSQYFGTRCADSVIDLRRPIYPVLQTKHDSS